MAAILVFEDNRDNMDLVKQILEDEGHTVLAAFRAEDGLTMLRNTSVDLILMDLSLPEVDGLEATRRIKADRALERIPVVALTAHARAADKKEALSAGCDDYLTKPIDEHQFLATVRRLVATP